MNMHVIRGGVTAAEGFRAAGCAAGIKYQGRSDMAMVFSGVPCVLGAVFTSNRVKAAPVIWDRDILQKDPLVQAIVVNSGIANAATGEAGLSQCRETADHVGSVLGIAPSRVLIGSTGVIGPVLPMDRVRAGIDCLASSLSDSLEAGTAASRAIMTTDTVNKECAVAFDLPVADGSGTVTVRLGGMSKGSGMIHPNMCTMLAYLTTDCAISQPLLQKAVSTVVRDTFNMISVDGDTSTNDTLLVLANGQAKNAPVTEEDQSYEAFCGALLEVCRSLAVKMAADGEGATHLIEVRITNADTKENARILARSVVSSSLVKAMIFGRDANCGRILCALGYAGPDFDLGTLEVYLEGNASRVCFYRDGCVQSFDEDLALSLLSEPAVVISCDMGMGSEEATAWGCDLTYDYVKINGDYRT